MTLKTECIGEPGQNAPSIWDEMEKTSMATSVLALVIAVMALIAQ